MASPVGSGPGRRDRGSAARGLAKGHRPEEPCGRLRVWPPGTPALETARPRAAGRARVVKTCPSRSALRSPLTLSSPFTTSFSLGSHSTLSGDLSMPSSYVSLHLSPQVSSSVVYGRSPVVSPPMGMSRAQGLGHGQEQPPKDRREGQRAWGPWRGRGCSDLRVLVAHKLNWFSTVATDRATGLSSLGSQAGPGG